MGEIRGIIFFVLSKDVGKFLGISMLVESERGADDSDIDGPQSE